LIRDEQHSSMGTILILSHYYNYDKESIPQCLQDNDYIRDYAENVFQRLQMEKVIQLRKILKRFECIASEGDILQCFEGEEDIKKVTKREGGSMNGNNFPLYVQKEDIPIPTLVIYNLHINKFEDTIGAWLEFVLSETSIAYRHLNALLEGCKYNICFQVWSSLCKLIILFFTRDLQSFLFVNKMFFCLHWKTHYTNLLTLLIRLIIYVYK
jgi:hypothetical protein